MPVHACTRRPPGRTATCLATLLIALLPGSARAASGSAAVDSASAARAAWREAVRANAAGDPGAVRTWVARAARAWPEQPAYWQTLARLDAKAGDAQALAATLTRLARLGSGARVTADSAVQAVASKGPGRTALGALENATAPHAASTAWATLADSTIFPEGADADPARGVVYVGSIRHRTIYAVEADGRARDLKLHPRAGIGAVMGVRWDARRGVLWATTVDHPAMMDRVPADSSIAALLKIDPADGRVLARYDAPAGEAHILGDLAVAPGGEVYVTDSVRPFVYTLAPDADTLRAFTHPLFRSLQGVAPAGDGVVYLSDYSHGMLRWLPASGEVARLAAPEGATTLGVDGIVLHRGTLYGVQNGVEPPRVVRMPLAADGRRITKVETLDRHWPLADEPTIATVLGDRLIYVANSQWEKYDRSGGRRAGTTLAAPVLLQLTIPR